MTKVFRIGLLAAWLMGTAGVGCTPGYIKAKDLESRGQGPAACEKSCSDLGMRMAALVLVGNELPGCVCQPLHVQGAPPNEPPKPAAEGDQGAAASTTGYVVLAAAAAARQRQDQQRRNAESSTKH